jgi:hypothetical protein
MATKAKTKSAPATLAKAALPADLDSLAAVILSALPSCSDEQREDIRAGDHKVDLTLTVRVQGELRVGEDNTVQQVNTLKPWTLCKLLADKVSASVLEDCITMALAASKAGRIGREEPAVVAMEAEADSLKARVEAVFQQAGQTVTKTRKGSVRLHGEVSVEVEE